MSRVIFTRVHAHKELVLDYTELGDIISPRDRRRPGEEEIRHRGPFCGPRPSSSLLLRFALAHGFRPFLLLLQEKLRGRSLVSGTERLLAGESDAGTVNGSWLWIRANGLINPGDVRFHEDLIELVERNLVVAQLINKKRILEFVRSVRLKFLANRACFRARPFLRYRLDQEYLSRETGSDKFPHANFRVSFAQPVDILQQILTDCYLHRIQTERDYVVAEPLCLGVVQAGHYVFCGGLGYLEGDGEKSQPQCASLPGARASRNRSCETTQWGRGH